MDVGIPFWAGFAAFSGTVAFLVVWLLRCIKAQYQARHADPRTRRGYVDPAAYYAVPRPRDSVEKAWDDVGMRRG